MNQVMTGEIPRPEAEQARIAGPTPAGWQLIAFGMVACVGAADFFTGTDLQLLLFYLAPIGLGTWFASRRGGIGLALASAAISTCADIVHLSLQFPVDSGAAVVVWNGVMLLGSSLALVLTLG